MLQACQLLLQYRVDLILLALITAAACWWISRKPRGRRPACRPPVKAFVAAGLITAAGGILAEWGATARVHELERMFSGFGPTYASELAQHGHARITFDTPADDPTYLEIIDHEKAWLAANPMIADVYTFRQDAEKRIRLIVDSETDYNHNGKIDEGREERTRIGESYDEATPKFYRALAGETLFESEVMTDRWGVWVSSFAPILGPDGQVEAAVGIDYPAQTWLVAIASIRGVCLGLALVLNAIVLSSALFIAFLAAENRVRKEIQQRLEQASESAFSASAAKSEYLALMSHEVRTPLSAILGFAQVLGDTPLDDKQRRYVDTINRAGSGLMELLNDILDYTKVENGIVKLNRVAWAPALLVHEVMELMSASALERGLQFHFDNQLPGTLTLMGDPIRVRQVLLNLVSNAVKYTAKGSVTVRADWQPIAGGSGRGRLTLTVSDTGAGIPAVQLPQLFRAFSAADASTTRRAGGASLGLAICQRLVDLMGGQIGVQSTPNVGSTFTFSVDNDSADVVTVAPRPFEGPAPAAAPGTRVLVIDDTKLNRELLKVMLRRLGLEADLAGSGPEGIALAAQHRYEIIFTDLEMPDMDGFAATRAIRAQEPAGRRVPIVAVSARTAAGTRESCVDAGMDEYMTKPVYLPALQSMIEAILPQHRVSSNAVPARTTRPAFQPQEPVAAA
jgi:signal transduction histidine kinase/CheY-like chemotaxis protein